MVTAVKMKNCPCGSGRQYSECCGLYISGKAKAPTAETLMRSRYTAYALHNIDYALKTYAHRNRKDIDYEATRKYSEQSQWLGLKIIKVEKGGINDTEGTVEFEASYIRDGIKDIHHEKAKFRKETVDELPQWFYDEGQITHSVSEARTDRKTGRNEPCPCGSGKKYKHCCLNSKSKANIDNR